MAQRLKKGIRSLTRLIEKKKDEMQASDLAEKTAALESLKQQLLEVQGQKLTLGPTKGEIEHEKKVKKKKRAEFYEKIRFFEKKKVLRSQKRLRKVIAASLEGSAEEKSARKELKQINEHLLYVEHYPDDIKYCALYPSQEGEVDQVAVDAHEEKVKEIMKQIKQKLSGKSGKKVAAAAVGEEQEEESSGDEEEQEEVEVVQIAGTGGDDFFRTDEPESEPDVNEAEEEVVEEEEGDSDEESEEEAKEVPVPKPKAAKKRPLETPTEPPKKTKQKKKK
jgi:deoxycytidylate deaminase